MRDGHDVTKTEIVETETVFLGREHVRFLDETIKKIQSASGYKASKSQIIRILIEATMRKKLRYDKIENEDSLRQMLLSFDEGEPTRIRKR